MSLVRDSNFPKNCVDIYQTSLIFGVHVRHGCTSLSTYMYSTNYLQKRLKNIVLFCDTPEVSHFSGAEELQLFCFEISLFNTWRSNNILLHSGRDKRFLRKQVQSQSRWGTITSITIYITCRTRQCSWKVWRVLLLGEHPSGKPVPVFLSGLLTRKLMLEIQVHSI